MGGHRFKNCSSIKKEHIYPTLKEFFNPILPQLGISYTDIRTLGSVFKKDESGDIDILINGDIISENLNIKEDKHKQIPELIYEKIKGIYPEFETGFTGGLKISNIKFPIIGDDGKFVQIDIMTTFGKDCLRLGEFIYHSPGNNSKYKGSHRTSLLYTILRFVHVYPIEYFENGSIKSFDKFSLLPRGLVKQRKTLEGKNGTILKNPRTVVDVEEIISTEPNEIIKYILGEDATINDADSFEKIFQYIEDKRNWDLYNQRSQIYKNWIKSFGKGLEIPIEINSYL